MDDAAFLESSSMSETVKSNRALDALKTVANYRLIFALEKIGIQATLTLGALEFAQAANQVLSSSHSDLAVVTIMYSIIFALGESVVIASSRLLNEFPDKGVPLPESKLPKTLLDFDKPASRVVAGLVWEVLDDPRRE